jgi:hypothetical protein
MIMQSPEHEIRVLTIQALRDATSGFDEFDRRIEVCCAAFEDGQDLRGRSELAAMAGPLRDFAQFCHAVMGNCGTDLDPETIELMVAANRKFEQALQAVVDEAEEQNFLGVSDVCRFDLAEAMQDYRDVFPRMVDELEQAS